MFLALFGFETLVKAATLIRSSVNLLFYQHDSSSDFFLVFME